MPLIFSDRPRLGGLEPSRTESRLTKLELEDLFKLKIVASDGVGERGEPGVGGSTGVMSMLRRESLGGGLSK